MALKPGCRPGAQSADMGEVVASVSVAGAREFGRVRVPWGIAPVPPVQQVCHGCLSDA